MKSGENVLRYRGGRFEVLYRFLDDHPVDDGSCGYPSVKTVRSIDMNKDH